MNSDAQPARPLLALLLVLTFVTGLVDAASFLAMGHVFTANMTGNIVLLAFASSGAPGLSIARSLLALASALAGGLFARRLHTVLHTAGQSRWLSTVWIFEAALLCTASLLAWFQLTHPLLAIHAIVALAALAMGLRNGTMRALAVPDMTTTVLTLTVAALAFDFSFTPHESPRWRRRVASIAAMFMGACVGTLGLRISLAATLALCALLTFLCALIARCALAR